METYIILTAEEDEEGISSIECLKCGCKSYHPDDIIETRCNRCETRKILQKLTDEAQDMGLYE